MSAPTKTDDKKAGAGIKVLRIGIVQNGKIIDERELKKRDSVSFGTTPKATFQVTSDTLPKSFDMFEAVGPKYFLRFIPGMEGKIQLTGTDVKTFEDLRALGKVSQRGDAEGVELSDESRGKVMINDITVLFQFKQLLAEPSRPILPSDAKGSLLSNMDAQFATIFILVAVFQISLVVYARSLPWVEPSSIEDVDKVFQKMIMPDRAPQPPAPQADATKGDDKKVEAKKDEPKKDTTPKKSGEVKKPVDAEKAAQARKEAATKKAAGAGLLKVLGSNSRNGGAINDVFSEGTASTGLDTAFSGIQGMGIATAGDQRGTRGGGAGTGVGIGDLQTSGGGNVNVGGKQEAAVGGVLKTETPEVDGKLSSDQIAAVMKRNLKALRDCYEGALKRNRTLSGKLTIKFEIDESGKTQRVTFEEDSLGSAEVKECIGRRAKYWSFPKPDGGSVFVAYPIVFTPST